FRLEELFAHHFERERSRSLNFSRREEVSLDDFRREKIEATRRRKNIHRFARNVDRTKGERHAKEQGNAAATNLTHRRICGANGAAPQRSLAHRMSLAVANNSNFAARHRMASSAKCGPDRLHLLQVLDLCAFSNTAASAVGTLENHDSLARGAACR